MRKMGGTIALTSTVGEGTTMVVTLPWREVEKE
jgi:signal transduction histidine kinase